MWVVFILPGIQMCGYANERILSTTNEIVLATKIMHNKQLLMQENDNCVKHCTTTTYTIVRIHSVSLSCAYLICNFEWNYNFDTFWWWLKKRIDCMIWLSAIKNYWCPFLWMDDDSQKIGIVIRDHYIQLNQENHTQKWNEPYPWYNLIPTHISH